MPKWNLYLWPLLALVLVLAVLGLMALGHFSGSRRGWRRPPGDASE